METSEFEVFLHGKERRPQVVNARPDETLRQLLERLDALPGDGQYVFVGEGEDARNDPDAAADTHAPADVNQALAELGLQQRRHVHTRTVERVHVAVHFNGKHHDRAFSPATTIATVTLWAKNKFQIDPTAGADLVLQLRSDKSQPRPDEHLGELLSPGSHALDFDLVREVTPQG